MKRETDNERLLTDALVDGEPSGFRETVLVEMLHNARVRRNWRQVRRGAAVLLISLGTLAFWLVPKQPQSSQPIAVAQPKPAFEIVTTQPLPPTAIVITVPLPANQLVASVATADVIETASVPVEYRELNDDELLAILAPRRPLLVGCGPNCKQVIFLNPGSENSIPVN